MALSLSDLNTMLDALQTARYKGVRSTTVGGVTITWASDDELASKIVALQRQIATTGSTTTRRVVLLQTERG